MLSAMFIEGVMVRSPRSGEFDRDGRRIPLNRPVPLGCRCTIQPDTTDQTADMQGNVRHQQFRLVTEPPHQVHISAGSEFTIPGYNERFTMVGLAEQFPHIQPHTEIVLEVRHV